MSEQLNIAELRRLHAEASPGESAALVPAVLAALPALLDAAEERDELLGGRILNQHAIKRLQAKLADALADRKNLIYINSLLRDRPDLGNRAKTVDALISENAALKAKLAALVMAIAGMEANGLIGRTRTDEQLEALTAFHDAIAAAKETPQ